MTNGNDNKENKTHTTNLTPTDKKDDYAKSAVIHQAAAPSTGTRGPHTDRPIARVIAPSARCQPAATRRP